MNRTVKMLLRTGLNILEQSDRATEPVREHVAEAADLLRRKIRGEDHTLRYFLIFAAGVGRGWSLYSHGSRYWSLYSHGSRYRCTKPQFYF
jgi:hypothetical protein